MHSYLKHGLFTLIFLSSLFLTHHSFANSSSQDELDDIKAQISKTQTELSKHQQESQSAENDIEAIEKDIAKLAKALRENEQMQKQLNKRLATLLKNKTSHEKQLGKQKQALRDILVQQYQQGPEPELKFLLNQQDPVALGRALVYKRYLNQASSDTIQAVQQHILALDKTEKEIAVQQKQLQTAQQTHTENKSKLNKKRQQRQATLKNLQRRISEQGQHLNELLANEKRLEQALQLAAQRQKAAEAKPNYPFSKRKGRLPWPTHGKVKRSFGSQKATGSLKWQGIVIATKPEQDVMSVAPGKVVFSNWLRGFGMLIIIDHGQGYITLYGQNETLFKEVGDSVEQDEIVASVGEGADSSLYFELRHKGKPVDPIRWLSKRNK